MANDVDDLLGMGAGTRGADEIRELIRLAENAREELDRIRDEMADARSNIVRATGDARRLKESDAGDLLWERFRFSSQTLHDELDDMRRDLTVNFTHTDPGMGTEVARMIGELDDWIDFLNRQLERQG